MIELDMVRRMARRALFLAPVAIAPPAVFGGFEWGLSAAVGLAMTLGNLWLAARLIGGVADHNPQLLLPVAFGTFALGLAALTGLAFGLKASGLVYFPVTGLVLIGSHLALVLWEAAGAYENVASSPGVQTSSETADLRS